MSSHKLKSIDRDGKTVVLTYDAGEGTEIVKRVSTDEFDRELSLLKRFQLSQDIEQDELPDEGLDFVNEILETKKDLLQEMNDRFDLVNSNYSALKDFMSTVQMQRDKFHENMTKEAESSLQAVTTLMGASAEIQETALKQIMDKETLLKNIMSDIETRNEWTWEESRKTQNEVAKSRKGLELFKNNTQTEFENLFSEVREVLGQVAFKLREMEKKQTEHVEVSTKDTKALLSQYRSALSDKTEFLKQEEEDKYKDTYLNNELSRRTQVEKDKTSAVLSSASDLEKRVSAQANKLTSKVAKHSEYLSKVTEEAENGVAGFSDATLDFIQSLNKSRQELEHEIEKIRTEVSSCQRKITQVNRIFKHFTGIVESEQGRLLALLQKTEQVSEDWDDSFAFLMTHLDEGSLLNELQGDAEETDTDEVKEQPKTTNKGSWKFWEK